MNTDFLQWIEDWSVPFSGQSLLPEHLITGVVKILFCDRPLYEADLRHLGI